jgi:hypothetical protein
MMGAERSVTVPDELRALAVAVRRIGDGYRDDPETIAIAKDQIAARLAGLARRMEAARP